VRPAIYPALFCHESAIKIIRVDPPGCVLILLIAERQMQSHVRHWKKSALPLREWEKI
jgi:hypothetical protein